MFKGFPHEIKSCRYKGVLFIIKMNLIFRVEKALKPIIVFSFFARQVVFSCYFLQQSY